LRTFEDAVIFVFDIERCLGELGEHEYEVIARVILRGENPDRAAHEMHCTSRSVYRTLPEALDKLSKKLLRRGILSRSEISPKSCQGGKNGVFDLSS
jgi:DNA-directed RNA polymerase specialized sigma24 family protein